MEDTILKEVLVKTLIYDKISMKHIENIFDNKELSDQHEEIINFYNGLVTTDNAAVYYNLAEIYTNDENKDCKVTLKKHFDEWFSNEVIAASEKAWKETF